MNSANWVQLHEKRKKPFFYYRKIEAYKQMQWSPSVLKELGFSIDMSHLHIAIAPFGGPIAFTKDVSKNLLEKATLQVVRVFTSSGKHISSLQWTKEEKPIIGLGWTKGLELMCLTEDGSVRIFDSQKNEIEGPWAEKKKKGFSLNLDKSKDKVVMCKMWPEGIAAFTELGNLYVATELTKSESPWVKYDTCGVKKIHCLEVIPSEFLPRVIIAPNEDESEKNSYDEDEEGPEYLRKKKRTLIVCTEKKAINLNLRTGPFRNISLSPNGQYIALYTDLGELLVVSDDFSRIYLQFRTTCPVKILIQKVETEIVPKQLVWCENLAVIIYYEKPGGDDTTKSVLLMVGCFGDCVRFDEYETPIALCQEIDCVRIITNTSCEIIEPVNEHTVNIFRIGSLESSALLYDAYNDYKMKKPSSIKTIMSIRSKQKQTGEKVADTLAQAALECLNAACHEFPVPDDDASGSRLHLSAEFDADLVDEKETLQQRLLKAAAYGRSFCTSTGAVWGNPDGFLEKCKRLRVLNEIRHKDYGIPITYKQFLYLTPAAMVGRLALIGEHFLAYKICKYLDIEENEILVDWACRVARQSTLLINPTKKLIDKESAEAKKQLAEASKKIEEKILQKMPNVSLAQVALTAFNSKNGILAKSLLEREGNKDSADDYVNIIDQIPLFLKMEEIRLALIKAVSSGDPDLLYLVILYILKKGDRFYLYEKIQNNSSLRRLFISYSRMEAFDTLKEYYKESGKKRSLGFVMVKEALKLTEKAPVKKLEKAKKLFEQDEQFAVDRALTENQIDLIDIQKRLLQIIDSLQIPEAEKDSDKDHVDGTSVNETFYYCLLKAKQNKDIKEIGFEIKEKFQLPQRRYWLLKIRSLAELKDWKGLEDFSKKEESPVGYTAFVKACLAEGQEYEAVKYIPLVKDPTTKIDYYINLRQPMFKEAIKAAVDANDTSLLEYIYGKSTNPKTRDTIQDLIDEMSGRK